jgi:hypothetical protein
MTTMPRKPTSRERQALKAAKAYIEAKMKLDALEYEVTDWNHQNGKVLEIELADKDTWERIWWTI